MTVQLCGRWSVGGHALLAPHLPQAALVHVNTALVQVILTEPEWAGE